MLWNRRVRIRLFVCNGDVRICGNGRKPRGAAVGTRERLPWDEQTCYWAATGGHLDVPRWAREKGCPWSEETRAMAARLGYVGA